MPRYTYLVYSISFIALFTFYLRQSFLIMLKKNFTQALVGLRARRGEEDDGVAQGTSERQEKRALMENEDHRDPEGDLGTLFRGTPQNFLRILVRKDY